MGSECAVGWNIILNLSKFHNLFVIYASGSQKLPFSYKEALYKQSCFHFNFEKTAFLFLFNIENPFSKGDM